MDSVRNDPELATEVISLLGKELKSARKRIRELEAQIQQGSREDSIIIDNSRELQERAEAVETSADLLKVEVEKLGVENTTLRLLLEEASRDKQLRVKEEVAEEKYSIPPPEERLERDEPNLDLANKVKELEEALEVYYGKYKTQKEAKKTLRESLAELETRVKDLARENQELQQAAQSSSSKPSQALPMKPLSLPGRHEFTAFMNKFPQCDSRPHYSRLHPACARGVDITAYLDSDSKLAKFSSSFLYLPGRLLWCSSSSQHGLTLGPQHVFDTSKGHWRMKSTFEGQYGKSFELFYASGSWIFYGGTYLPQSSVLEPRRISNACQCISICAR